MRPLAACVCNIVLRTFWTMQWTAARLKKELAIAWGMTLNGAVKHRSRKCAGGPF